MREPCTPLAPLTLAVVMHQVALLDVASLESVRSFAEAWGERPLHLLINNAGIFDLGGEQAADQAMTLQLQSSTAQPACTHQVLAVQSRIEQIALCIHALLLLLLLHVRQCRPAADQLSLQSGSQHFTEDGFESHMGTNHLGHFLLTLLLLPALHAGASQARIDLHRSAKVPAVINYS